MSKPLHECFQDELTRRTGIDPGAAMPAWIRAGLGKSGLFSQARLLQSIRNGFVQLRGARLRNLQFSRLALEKVDFTGAILHNVSFEDAELRGASFADGVLDSVSFSRCNLSDSNFANAQMEFSTWQQVRAHRAHFSNASVHPMWESCDLSQSYLEGAIFRGGYVIQSQFTSCLLQGVQFLYAGDEAVYLSGVDFSGAQMNYLDLSECASKTGEEGGYAWLSGCSFVGAQLRQVDFNSTDCSLCNFTGANLEGADFFGARLQKARFHNANLSGARLAYAALQGAEFEQAELTGAELGSGTRESFSGAVWTERTDYVSSKAVQERRERKSHESMELALPSSEFLPAEEESTAPSDSNPPQEADPLRPLTEALQQPHEAQALTLEGVSLVEAGDALSDLGRLQCLQTLRWIDCGLEKLPGAVFELDALQELTVSQQRLTELSPAVSRLQKLRLLDLSSNELEELPGALGELRQLQVLDASENALRSLPEELGELEGLVELNLGWNQLAALPKSLLKLRHLRVLELTGNELKEEDVAFLREARPHLMLWI